MFLVRTVPWWQWLTGCQTWWWPGTHPPTPQLLSHPIEQNPKFLIDFVNLFTCNYLCKLFNFFFLFQERVLSYLYADMSFQKIIYSQNSFQSYRFWYWLSIDCILSDKNFFCFWRMIFLEGHNSFPVTMQIWQAI